MKSSKALRISALMLVMFAAAQALAANTGFAEPSTGLVQADSIIMPGNSMVPGGGRKLQQSCVATCKAQGTSQPVCGKDGKTYDNYCYAACASATVTYWGKCSTKPCLCQAIWAPVCAGGKTYLNKCMATCAGKSGSDGVCKTDCKCPSTKATVCGLDGKKYDNLCYAACAGTSVAYSGDCDARIGTCKCATVNDPVCATTYLEIKLPTGGVYRQAVNTTYASPCLAKCQGNATTWAKGACQDNVPYDISSWSCGCALTLQPVCTKLPVLGTLTTLTNSCLAKCFNFTMAYDGLCKGECICPVLSDPVCVTSGKTKTTYKNACIAKCQGGATTWSKGSCTPCSKCPTPAFTDYVCGKDGISYPSKCLAECVGVQVDHTSYCGAK